MSYYDTGVLLKLYTNEAESERVADYVRGQKRAIGITDLHLTEAITALRLKEFRNECRPDQATAAISCMEDDLRDGVLRMVTFDWPAAWIRCQTISRTEAGRIGVRTLDILHVACALTLHATQFVTNDQRQAKLAKKCGLSVINPCA